MKKKIVSLFAVLALCLAFAVPAFAANYSKWTATEFSGQTDFGYFYTYEGEDRCIRSVSYTHLTLPTTSRV